jgi:ubiquinone/menaquinone biosynthesis C-methylase UbiE
MDAERMSERAARQHDQGPVGNVYDKYGTRNLLARRLMGGFLNAVTRLYRRVCPHTVLEVGCGEGRLADHLLRSALPPDRFDACDLSLARLVPESDPAIHFFEASVYQLPVPGSSYDLVICCEVLEHLDDPARGLAELARVAKYFVLLSTPWEPTWRVLNLARGRYLRAFGNTPGHVQHFTRKGLRDLAQRRLVIDVVRTPLPWTVLLGRPARGRGD